LTEIEVLVLDDASTDDTAAIAEDYASRDSRVSVRVNSRRLGLAENWNKAVRSATGDWIKPLFQDDMIAPTCLERMTAMGGAMLVVCDRKINVEGGAAEEAARYIAGLPTMDALFGSDPHVSSEQVCAALVKHPGVNFFGEPSAVLLHRTALQRFGDFNTDMIQLCDLEYWARIGSQVGIARVPEELATFRVHERSASAANYGSRQFHKDVLDTLILFHEFAFGEHFAQLRAVPGSRFSELAARELQRAQADVAKAGDPRLNEALQDVLARHPKLKSPLWRLWRKVCKQLRSKP